MSNEESNRLTKECIQTALVNILSQKNIDDITISEVVSKAGVSRSAFYRNYKTKADVLEEISDNYIRDMYRLCHRAICDKDIRAVYEEIFARIKNEPRSFSLAYNAGFMESDILNIKKKIVSQLPEHEISVLYLLMGLAGMIKYIMLTWYLTGMQKSPEEMAELCRGYSVDVIDKIKKIDSVFLDKATEILGNQ